jgi:hypothetical protein
MWWEGEPSDVGLVAFNVAAQTASDEGAGDSDIVEVEGVEATAHQVSWNRAPRWRRRGLPSDSPPMLAVLNDLPFLALTRWQRGGGRP